MVSSHMQISLFTPKGIWFPSSKAWGVGSHHLGMVLWGVTKVNVMQPRTCIQQGDCEGGGQVHSCLTWRDLLGLAQELHHPQGTPHLRDQATFSSPLVAVLETHTRASTFCCCSSMSRGISRAYPDLHSCFCILGKHSQVVKALMLKFMA